MKAALDHFVQNRTKFDTEMIKSYRLVLQPVLVLNAVRWIVMTIIYVTDTK